MSLIDKSSKAMPDPENLGKSVADASGLTDAVNQKINDLTTPVSDAINQAKETLDTAKNTLKQTKENLGRATKIVANVTETDLSPAGTSAFELISDKDWAKMKGLDSIIAAYGGDLESQLKNSHIVYSTVQVAGQDVLKDSHFSLEIHQKMADHDSFTISCFAEAFGDRNAYPMTNSRNLLGKKATIQLKQFGQTTYIFTGIITEITNKKIDGYNKLFITGQAPTILLENGQDCQSFEDLPLDKIIEKATSEYPQDLVSWDVRPRMKDELKYTVQFRESDWAFVKRLATRYGEWIYYNGQQIVFGGFGGKTVELVEGQDIYDFELKMKLVPQKFTYVSYDAKQAKNHTVNSDSVPVTHRLVNPFQQHAIKASEEIYSKVPLSLYNQSLLEKGEMELKQAVERQKLNRQNVFFMEAKTNNPNLRLGDIVKMKAWMPGHEIFKNGEVPLESYKILEISHIQDVTEGYYNLIVGIPVDNMVPAYMNEDAIPECEEQSAVVTDNNDPDGMSRIRVQFPWQIPTQGQSPWIRVTTPYAGNGKGMHVIPEIGEEVIVSFENGNAEKPVVIGAMFNGQGKSGHGGAGNYNKGLQTASGSHIMFNDKDKSVVLKDPEKTTMSFDGNGNTLLNSSETIILTCGLSTLELHKDGTILINGKDIGVLASTSIAAGVGSKESVTSGIGIEASTLDVGTKILTMSGENEANLGAENINIGGTGETKIVSGTVRLN